MLLSLPKERHDATHFLSIVIPDAVQHEMLHC
jgi:hypothetical protein